MRSGTHVAVALALATAVPRVVDEATEGRPWLALLAVACALLPDLLERGWRRCAARPDIVVALDPLAPEAQRIVDGVVAAAELAFGRRLPCWLRVLPLPARPGGLPFAPYVHFDGAGKRVLAALREGGVESEGRIPPFCPTWPDRYVVPPVEGLLLRFWPGTAADPRLRCTVLERGWPHGLPFAIVVVAGLFLLWDPWAAWVGAGVLAAHLLLDHGGLLGVAWRAPFGTTAAPLGWRLWRGASPLVNEAVTWVAALLVFWNLAHRTDYLPWRPALVPLLIFGFGVPWLGLRTWERRRTRSAGARPGTRPS